MRPLLRSIASEYLKVFTTRMWWVLAIVLVAYVALTAGGLASLFGYMAENPDAARDGQGGGIQPGFDLQALVYGFATTVGYVFPVLLGALATTGEFRHATLTPTFLATPRRGLVLLAKVTVLFVIGALFGVFAWVATIGAGAGAFSAFGLETHLGEPEIWAVAARGVLAMGLWAAIGVGLGTLVTSQVAAIVIVLAFTQFVEPLLRLAAGIIEATAGVGRFLPGAASDSLVGSSFFGLMGSQQSDALDWWQGGLVLLAYAVVFTVAGYFTSWRKDVT